IPRRGRAQGRSPASANLRFLAVADTGSGDANQRAVGQQMAAVHRRRAVDLVLLGGDNIYPSGDLKLVESTFRRPYAELLGAGVPFHAVLGNHDIRTANGGPQVAYPPFGMGGRYYAIRRGPVEFFLLDTNVNADWQRQVSWLRGALARSQAPWKVVVGHHPIYSSGFYGNDPHLAAKLSGMMRRHGVALYINGHDHNYERSRPIDGITYLVVGGGGASLRPVLATAQTAKAASVFSFAELEAGPRELKLWAWDKTGRQIDQAVLTRASA
ncbi:MAG: metallophosphoesterase, partial [Cyanobacteriota bacterium]|nr:metallophosphoesterase [Cyanobacteriota bacterium]